ncbi:MAG: hypothetical protein ACK6A8_17445 [Planctomycetota bacterium]
MDHLSWQRLKRVALFLFVAVLIGVAWLAYNGITHSIRAERNLHSTLYVVRLVDEFVYENQRWPKSWAELEQMQFAGDAYTPRNGELNVLRVGGAMTFQWPTDSLILQSRVNIDFDADLNQIGTQNPMGFDAIKPIGPYFEYRHYGIVDSLQETIRYVPNKKRINLRLDSWIPAATMPRCLGLAG